DDADAFQLIADGIVDVATAGVIGRNDKRVLWLGGIVLGNSFNALGVVRDLGHAPLSLQQADTYGGFILGEMFDDTEQLRVFLAHDLVKLRGLHPGLLHLLKGFAGIDALMLAGVSHKQNPVLRPNLFHETLHLASAGEAGFIDHIKMSPVGIALPLLMASACKKTLQRV